MEKLTQRLPLEAYQLVDKTITEVENRHSLDLRNLGTRRREQKGFVLDKSEAHAEVLADLLWTLYSKLAAVLSGHRIVHDCVLAIVKELKHNDSLIDTPEFNYIEVWKPIQSEVTPPCSGLMQDTISTPGLFDERCPSDIVSPQHHQFSERNIHQTTRQGYLKGTCSLIRC